MLCYRLLPCQQWDAPMWAYKTEDPVTVPYFLGTTYDKLCRVLFKPHEEDWLAEDEEDIGLDDEHPPKKVTRILPVLNPDVHSPIDLSPIL